MEPIHLTALDWVLIGWGLIGVVCAVAGIKIE